jgi:MFS family permease
LAVLLITVGVEDQAGPDAVGGTTLRWSDLGGFSASFWLVVAVAVVFSLARFSEAFLILKANEEGLTAAFAPLVLVAMNLFYAGGAYPAGALSDRLPPQRLLLGGLIVLALGDLILAFGHGLAAVFSGIALWGIHLALTQGVLSRMIADRAPPRLRGSAFGLFNLATGLALLAASLAAGLLWDALGSRATFLAAAGWAMIAGLLLVAFRGDRPPPVSERGELD